MERAENEGLETGDFIFKQGYSGFERMKTGARRSSATKLISDPSFTRSMEERLVTSLPGILKDGRRFLGLRESFLLSRSSRDYYRNPAQRYLLIKTYNLAMDFYKTYNLARA